MFLPVYQRWYIIDTSLANFEFVVSFSCWVSTGGDLLWTFTAPIMAMVAVSPKILPWVTKTWSGKFCFDSLKDKSGVDKIVVKKQPSQLLNTNREFFPCFDASYFHKLVNECS